LPARPPVTGKHYNHAQRKNMEAKRNVLDRWAAELRRIVGTPESVDLEQRLAVTQRRSRDATDVTNREAAICWEGAA
jgi:hypothetical protein